MKSFHNRLFVRAFALECLAVLASLFAPEWLGATLVGIFGLAVPWLLLVTLIAHLEVSDIASKEQWTNLRLWGSFESFALSCGMAVLLVYEHHGFLATALVLGSVPKFMVYDKLSDFRPVLPGAYYVEGTPRQLDSTDVADHAAVLLHPNYEASQDFEAAVERVRDYLHNGPSLPPIHEVQPEYRGQETAAVYAFDASRARRLRGQGSERAQV